MGVEEADSYLEACTREGERAASGEHLCYVNSKDRGFKLERFPVTNLALR